MRLLEWMATEKSVIPRNYGIFFCVISLQSFRKKAHKLPIGKHIFCCYKKWLHFCSTWTNWWRCLCVYIYCPNYANHTTHAILWINTINLFLFLACIKSRERNTTHFKWLLHYEIKKNWKVTHVKFFLRIELLVSNWFWRVSFRTHLRYT